MILKSQITDVFFDLDHTLWDFDKNSGLAFGRVFKTFKINLKLSKFLEVYEPINLKYWRLYRNDQVSKTELRRGRFNEAFAFFNMQFSLEQLDLMAQAYIDELPLDNHLFDHAIELLEYLKDQYRLHLITNGFEEVQHKKLRNSNIARYFLTVMTSEKAGVKKPNPIIFHKALSGANAKPDSSVMIGDSLEADVMGAHDFGIHTIYFNYKNEQKQAPQAMVHSLEQIKGIL